MPLTKGQVHALHMLLMTRSQFRLQLEGKYLTVPGVGGAGPTTVYAENIPPTYKAADDVTLVNTLIAQAVGLGISAGNFDAATRTKLKLLFDPAGTDLNGVQTNVSTNVLAIRRALAMDATYPDNTPCPPVGDQSTIAAAIIAALPGPLSQNVAS